MGGVIDKTFPAWLAKFYLNDLRGISRRLGMETPPIETAPIVGGICRMAYDGKITRSQCRDAVKVYLEQVNV